MGGESRKIKRVSTSYGCAKHGRLTEHLVDKLQKKGASENVPQNEPCMVFEKTNLVVG
jgi:hypothetical protein